MDGAAVGCRYFGLGDDRPYFHPSAPISPPASSRSACVCISIPIYRDISHSRTVRPVLRAKQRPTFRTRRKLADGGLSSQRSSLAFPFFILFFFSLPLSFFSYHGSFQKVNEAVKSTYRRVRLRQLPAGNFSNPRWETKRHRLLYIMQLARHVHSPSGSIRSIRYRRITLRDMTSLPATEYMDELRKQNKRNCVCIPNA